MVKHINGLGENRLGFDGLGENRLGFVLGGDDSEIEELDDIDELYVIEEPEENLEDVCNNNIEEIKPKRSKNWFNRIMLVIYSIKNIF